MVLSFSSARSTSICSLLMATFVLGLEPDQKLNGIQRLPKQDQREQEGSGGEDGEDILTDGEAR